MQVSCWGLGGMVILCWKKIHIGIHDDSTLKEYYYVGEGMMILRWKKIHSWSERYNFSFNA